MTKEQLTISFFRKAEWVNGNGEEVLFFDSMEDVFNIIYMGLAKNFDGWKNYSNTDHLLRTFIIAKGCRPSVLITALTHPNEHNIKRLDDDEHREFNAIIADVNPTFHNRKLED